MSMNVNSVNNNLLQNNGVFVSQALKNLTALMLGHWGSCASSYLADPTSPIPSHCAVITLFKSVPVHQLSQLAL